MDALNSMQNFLRSRPKTFKSLENAIEWSVKSGQIRNPDSARVSMAGQIKQCEEDSSPEAPKAIVEGIIEEEEEEEDEEDNGGHSINKRKKEDDTELLLAGVDRLDKDLTIGQMQVCTQAVSDLRCVTPGNLL
ncbi:hypothetical protein AB205_0166510 [Aquarana catesbeiana]|uniref:Uncharacterized protein n=1 Tax=Aquarana catesbeiana TaxID=8400 RepID=A0A2G9R3T0_AQUCT|nr:hypothetical protein AB205_0166510 [Aquarana catesbeiana]